MRRASIITVAALGLLAGAAHADTFIGIHTLTHHINPEQDNLNEVNTGLYIRKEDLGSVGCYRNSYRRTSCYVTAGWQITPAVDVSLGVVTGYKRHWIELPLSSPLCQPGWTWCGRWDTRHRTALLPMASVSVNLGGGIRLSALPGKNGLGLIHLSLEQSWK